MAEKISLGQMIDGKYKIVKLIGEGGMSYVYQAKDLESKNDVAIKFLKRDITSSYAEDNIRFQREIKAVSKLNHPDIVKIYSAGNHYDIPYIIMELIRGESLHDYLANGKTVSINDSIKITKSLSNVLSYVHSNNLLHRDIKPGNIMLVKNKGHIKVKLLDFGIALVMELKNMTDKEEIVGTFGYMSPEATGILKKRVDERSDLYSLGVVFYKLLTGKSPFNSTELRALLHEQVTSNLISPSKHDESIPSVLSNIVMKLLEKEQDYRYQSAKGLIFDLDKILSGENDFIIGQRDQKVKLTYQTRLVGREKEFNKLKELIENARKKEGALCLIAGDPGAGKSRLVESVREYVYEQGYGKGGLFLEGRCASQANKVPYQPFKDVLNEYVSKFEKLDEGSQKKESLRIKHIVGELGKIITKLNSNMEVVLDEVAPLVSIDPERENQRFLMVLSNFFLNLAEEGYHCILYLDDLQWADEGTLRLIEEIAGDIAGTNLLIIGTYRANEVDESHSLFKLAKKLEDRDAQAERIYVKSFDLTNMTSLVAGILGQSEDRSDKFGKYVLEKSGGNPFFAITIIREIVQQGAIKWEEDSWKEDWKKIEAIEIPINIIDMIIDRLDDIPDDVDNMLKVGAAIGKDFEIDMLQCLIGKGKEELVSLIDQAVELQLVEYSLSKKGKIIFVHDRIKESFYQKMSKKETVETHLKIGNEIEARLKEKKDDKFFFDLVYHFFEAKDDEKTLKYALPAAEKAAENYANEDAVKYYEICISLLENSNQTSSEKWLKTVHGLVDIYLNVGNSDDAIVYAEALLDIEKSVLERAKIYRQLGSAYFKKGDWKNCEYNMAQGLKLLGESIPLKPMEVTFSLMKELFLHFFNYLLPINYAKKPNKKANDADMEKAWIHLNLSWLYVLSDTNKFICNALRNLNLAERRLGKSKELGASVGGYASFLMAIPLFDLSIKNHKKAIMLTEELKDEWSAAQSIQFLGYCYTWKGEYKISLDTFLEAKEKYEHIGDMWELGMVYNGIGHANRYMGNYQKGLDAFNNYLQISKKIKDDYGVCSAETNLMLCYINTGDYSEAEKFGKHAINLSAEKNIWYANCFASAFFGYLKLEQGNYEEALFNLNHAREIYERNTYLKDYTIFIYPYTAEALVEKYIALNDSYNANKKKSELLIIKKACKKALAETKLWVNYYGLSVRIYAKYHALLGKNKSAKKYFEQSIVESEKLNRVNQLAKSHYEYGNFFNQLGEKEKGIEQWQQAYQIFKEIGSKAYIKRCEDLLDIKVSAEVEDEISPQERLRLERRMNTALDTGRYLSSILILDELLEKIMDKTIELVGAERGVLFLYPESKKDTQLKAEAKVLRNIKREGIDISSIQESVLPIVEKNRMPLISADASVDQSISEHSMSSSNFAKNLKSVLCAPIVTKGNLLGMIYLDNHLVTELFSDEDLNVLNLIASQAGVSIENARLYQNLQEQERLKKEMEIAERIQTAIVPDPPEHKELEISAVMRPAEEVGGDYYDIIYDNQDSLWFAIGDVSGHGVTPGLIMMMAQSSFSSYIKGDKSITPKDVIVKVNSILTENIRVRLKEAHFMTMSFIKYLGKGNFIFSNAGHPDIIIYRVKQKSCELIRLDSLYLGIKPDISEISQNFDFKLSKGDIMLLYTDGVVESRHKDDKRCMGPDILQDIIIENASKSLDDLKSVVLERTLDWCGNRPADDITMVFVKMK